MKKLLLLIATATLYSCIPYAERSHVVDLTRYKMFITESNSVNFDYRPVGIVTAVVVDGYDGLEYIEGSVEDAIRVLHDAAKKSRADGVINLKIEFGKTGGKSGRSSKMITASGMAIRMYDEYEDDSYQEKINNSPVRSIRLQPSY